PNEVCFQGPFAGVSVIAGRSFHLSYENGLTQFFMLADTLGLFVGEVIALIPSLMLAPFIRTISASYYLAFEWVVFGSLQWWFVGGWLHAKLKTSTMKRL